MREAFVRDGFQIVEPSDEADVYVVNSCTVTAGADSKTRQMLRRFRRQNESAVIALCGCFPQAFPEEAELIPEADILLGSSNRGALLAAVKTRMAGGEKVIAIQPHTREQAFEPMKVESFGQRTRAFVKIQDGCERFCSYCIIPFARGPVRSKSLEDLKEELEDLVTAGYREVVLVGINLSSYGTDLGYRLLDAILLADSVEGIQRVRLGSLEPELLSKEDIDSMAKLESFCPQFHLSLQSGSETVLKRMRRPYTIPEYRRIVEDLRNAFENCAITTDIMVGFPEETEEEHQESLAFVKEIGFARAHVFAYSPRPGTRAAKIRDQVSGSSKAERSQAMIAVTDQTRTEFLLQQVGRTEEVLFETKHGNYWEGYSKNYTPIRVTSEKDLAGEIYPVMVTGVEQDHCLGTLA